MTNYIKQFKLSHDPFLATAKCRSFFHGGGREELLSRLVEQAHYGAPMSSVCGGLGSGKTILAREFQNSFSDEALCIRVQATLFMNQNQFLEAVLEQLPIGAPTPNPEEIVESIAQFADRLYLDAKTLVVIVDDAHELASDVLGIIDGLTRSATESAVHVLLLGENQLGNMLHNALGDSLAGRLLEEELAPLDSESAMQYVRLKLADAGYCGEFPIATGEMGRIFNEANGLPGVINGLTAAALSDLDEEGLRKQAAVVDKNFWLRVSAPYWGVAAVLLLMLLATVTLTSSGPEVAGETTAENQAEQATTRIQLPLEIAAANVASNNSSPLPTARNIEPTIEMPTVHTDGEAVTFDKEQSPLSGEIPNPVGEPVRPAEASQAEPATTALALSESERQLLAYPDEYFTVQIMGSRSENSVQSFVDRRPGAFDYRYYETLHEDKPWFVVVMGGFVSRDVANQAIADLPASIRELKPWVRSLADIQAQILQAH